MKDFTLELDLLGALTLFNLLQDAAQRGYAQDQACLDALEAKVRLFLYDELSIEEMENPRSLQARLQAEREQRKARE